MIDSNQILFDNRQATVFKQNYLEKTLLSNTLLPFVYSVNVMGSGRRVKHTAYTDLAINENENATNS